MNLHVLVEIGQQLGRVVRSAFAWTLDTRRAGAYTVEIEANVMVHQRNSSGPYPLVCRSDCGGERHGGIAQLHAAGQHGQHLAQSQAP